MATKQKVKKPLHLAKMNIKKGDTVLIITGKDRGKQGTVSRALPQVDKVIVEGLNMVKKHVRPQGQTRQGGVIDKAMPIHVSNTMLICTECGQPTPRACLIGCSRKYAANITAITQSSMCGSRHRPCAVRRTT